MSLAEQKRMPFRLPHDLAERLDRVRRRNGQTAQNFILQAVRGAIEAEEAKRQAQREARRQQEEARYCAPQGLGLGLRPGGRPVVEAPAAPAPSVVVNVSDSRQDKDILAACAAYVVKGSEHEQDRRRRVAMDVLKMGAATEEEHAALVRQLDQAVAAKLAEQGARAGQVVKEAVAAVVDLAKTLL